MLRLGTQATNLLQHLLCSVRVAEPLARTRPNGLSAIFEGCREGERTHITDGLWESSCTKGVRSMTLTRGRLIGYEFDRMVMLFSMVDGQREIPCAISTSAMDHLESLARPQPNQREAQFLRLRDRIEECAVRKFLAMEFEGTPPGIILRSIDFQN